MKRKTPKLTTINIELKATIAELTKNSSNSSKPPSSDIVSPPKTPDKRKKRKQDAQKGHKRNLRTAFDPEQINDVKKTTLDKCPSGGSVLIPADKPARVHQLTELVEKTFRITEYHQKCYWCGHCGTYHYVTLPEVSFPACLDQK